MRPVFKRIALNGILTALILGVIGFLFGELAGLWLTGAANRTQQESDASLRDAIRYRIPLLMALWGFVFIAVAEVVLFLWRGEPQARPANGARAAKPDEAGLLLEELLKQAEAKAALEPGTGGRGQGTEGAAGTPAQNGSPSGAGAVS